MAQVYLSLGTNIDREKHLNSGLTALEKIFGSLVLSSIFESDSVGFDGSPFYNMVIGFQTKKCITELSQCLRILEFEHGREVNAKKFSARTLDIDILLYNDLILTAPVQIPRDEILFNAFVLSPLAEIAPNEIHPVNKKTYLTLWQAFDQTKQHLTAISLTWVSSKDQTILCQH